jgi:hypothetical protein
VKSEIIWLCTSAISTSGVREQYNPFFSDFVELVEYGRIKNLEEYGSL